MLYFALGIVLSFFSFLEIISKNRNFFKIVFFVLLFLMLLLVGLRDGRVVGMDSPAYYEFYLDQLPSVEIGYKYLNYFFSSLGLNYNIFLLFINFIILFNISKFIRLNSYYLILPLFIYFSDFFFYYSFSGIRQSIAISFAALSIYYIFENKNKLALLLILIGSLFHVTALIFIVAFFVPNARSKISKYAKFFIVLIVGAVLGSYIIESVPYLNSKFIYYSSSQDQLDNTFFNYIIGIIKRLIVLISVLLVFRNFFSNNKNFYLYNLYLVGFVVYVASYLISPDFGVRLGSYFIVVDCLLISRYISSSNQLMNKIVLFLVFILVAMYKIYTYTLLDAFEYKLLGL